jgi:hypothetical protein
MEIRAAELTADQVGRTVKIDPGDQTSLVGRLVRVQHNRSGMLPLRRPKRGWSLKSQQSSASVWALTASA